MDDNADTAPCAAETVPCEDRRQHDRRVAAAADYTGPERRVAARRIAADRRKDPRF